MKCQHCGANLELTHAFCPHCGQANAQVQKHIEDMNRYEGEFQSTKENVQSVTESYKGIVVRVVVLAALVILSVLVFGLKEASYDIKRSMDERNAKKNMETNIQIFEEYMAAENYLELYHFCENAGVDGFSEEYGNWYGTIRVARYYNNFYGHIINLDEDPEGKTYTLERLAESVITLYEGVVYPYSMYSSEAEAMADKQRIGEIVEQAELLLMSQCHLTEEEIEALPEMSEAEVTLLLEEKIYGGK
ncbi:MAG: zinc ribbon domain-containing protein [Lachnospiraceae bacterium]|nr:zinc ribbon domain-containing protein [Lachnospiraceae bacterium]